MDIWSVLGPNQCIDIGDRELLLSHLRHKDVEVIEFHGEGVSSKASFFVQAHIDLPQPRGRLANGSWDALSDNLYETLCSVTAKRIILIWSHPNRLYDTDLYTFLIALGTLQIALSEWVSQDSPHRAAFVMFMGKGSSFHRLQLTRVT